MECGYIFYHSCNTGSMIACDISSVIDFCCCLPMSPLLWLCCSKAARSTAWCCSTLLTWPPTRCPAVRVPRRAYAPSSPPSTTCSERPPPPPTLPPPPPHPHSQTITHSTQLVKTSLNSVLVKTAVNSILVKS